MSRNKKKPSSKLETVAKIVDILVGISTIIGTIYSVQGLTKTKGEGNLPDGSCHDYNR